NKKSKELNFSSECNFLKPYLFQTKDKMNTFISFLFEQISPFGKKVVMEKDATLSCEYARRLVLTLREREQDASEKENIKEKQTVIEKEENSELQKTGSKKKKRRRPKIRNHKAQTRENFVPEISTLETNSLIDLHDSPAQIEEPQTPEKEEVISFSQPLSHQTDAIEPIEKKKPKNELTPEVEDKNPELLPEAKPKASQEQRKLKSYKKEKLNSEEQEVDSQKKGKKKKKGKTKKPLKMKDYLKRKRQKETSLPPPAVHIIPNPTIGFTKKAKKKFEQMGADYVRKKVQVLFEELVANPVGTRGIGKPERLTGGGYSRRITDKDRLVYDIGDSGEILVNRVEDHY
ncbi:MAG TPA: type II toxin-antitoxin system YoeB family toxin, partial [Alphaproteobacteria bacterium]|nr:type II toxin-antitoxin system YoeB family toxin [Alphaproteobacteria bacterium]